MTDSAGMEERLEVNGWRELGRQLVDRTKRPWRHVSFVLYFFIGVLACGALGVWFETFRWINQPENGIASIVTALETFFPALVGSTSLQVIFAESDNKRMRAFAVGYLGVFVAVVIILMFITRIPTSVALALSIASSLLSLWVWWIANAYNPAFQDVDDQAPLGGPVGHRPVGSLTGFQA